MLLIDRKDYAMLLLQCSVSDSTQGMAWIPSMVSEMTGTEVTKRIRSYF